MFSSHGQVSSVIITFLGDLEKSNTSGRRVETAKKTGIAPRTDDLFGLYDERKFFSILTSSQRSLSCLKLKRL